MSVIQFFLSVSFFRNRDQQIEYFASFARQHLVPSVPQAGAVLRVNWPP